MGVSVTGFDSVVDPKTQKQFVFYKVTSSFGTVEKRFSEFDKLYTQLTRRLMVFPDPNKTNPVFPEVPSKKIFKKMDDSQILKRQGELDTFMKALENVRGVQSAPEWKDFFVPRPRNMEQSLTTRAMGLLRNTVEGVKSPSGSRAQSPIPSNPPPSSGGGGGGGGIAKKFQVTKSEPAPKKVVSSGTVAANASKFGGTTAKSSPALQTPKPKLGSKPSLGTNPSSSPALASKPNDAAKADWERKRQMEREREREEQQARLLARQQEINSENRKGGVGLGGAAGSPAAAASPVMASSKPSLSSMAKPSFGSKPSGFGAAAAKFGGKLGGGGGGGGGGGSELDRLKAEYEKAKDEDRIEDAMEIRAKIKELESKPDPAVEQMLAALRQNYERAKDEDRIEDAMAIREQIRQLENK